MVLANASCLVDGEAIDEEGDLEVHHGDDDDGEDNNVLEAAEKVFFFGT